MLFRKASTRTRISFEVGIQQLGGFAIHLPPNELQIGRGETIEDTARVLSRYVDGIIVRTYEQQEIEDLAQHASIPIINGLTDLLHPCQVMADLLTIQERRGELKGLRLVYVGDGNNMAHSLMVGGAKFGMHVCVCTPEGFGPDPEILASAQTCAAETGGSVEARARSHGSSGRCRYFVHGRLGEHGAGKRGARSSQGIRRLLHRRCAHSAGQVGCARHALHAGSPRRRNYSRSF